MAVDNRELQNISSVELQDAPGNGNRLGPSLHKAENPGQMGYRNSVTHLP
jgi:hypothetical protein